MYFVLHFLYTREKYVGAFYEFHKARSVLFDDKCLENFNFNVLKINLTRNSKKIVDSFQPYSSSIHFLQPKVYKCKIFFALKNSIQ